ncbi:cadmium-translocating P-type ATPase [Micromonospora sp. 15K316]|uniref:heavy metal translocating P-type ATPase n=1 Tax=Micromonospora sp. 15K316 TaxID=2530376 RepID=UPI001045AD3E|nr:heavy metal translocating P-type ATPase [Micromonospora sp. 15K316]TDC30058.1 cadmium-translocating P-type ATPase [Micromonospora sp. 15K316]
MSTDLWTRPESGAALRRKARPRRTPVWALPEARWATATLGLFAAGGVTQLAGGPGWAYWTLYLACYAAGGWEPGLAGLRALRDRTLDVDLLMVLAAIGAAAIGQVFDGALLIVIFATSGALEVLATRRTADSVRGLLDLAPPRATRLRGDGDEEAVDTAALTVGDVIVVRPGERIGADGEVLDGAGDVDQATITGESLPVGKGPGDEVYAGTLNGAGVLRVRVTREPADTVVARIVAMVEQASGTKARTQMFIEKVEQRYSLGVVVATLLVFSVPLAAGEDFSTALLRAMTFMIVASPCAVVLATMPPLLAAIAQASRHGVLVKSAVVMERLGDISQVAFDKTGTLTEGRARLVATCLVPGGPLDDEEQLLSLAASAEQSSEHHLAAATICAARERALVLSPATAFLAHPGRGVTARIGGRDIAVGSPAHLLPHGRSPAHRLTDELEDRGYTVVVVTVDGEPAGVLGIADRIRPAAAAVVTRLAALTRRAPVLLTGDNARAAAQLSSAVGISSTRAGLLPAEKVAAIREFESDGTRVLMVGDGVNDAPALAAAHVGMAMAGAGSDLAVNVADAVVVRDDLTAIPAVVALSRRARRYVVANLTIAATTIVVLAGWDILGSLPLPLAVAGHEGSTVVVALNGLRLLSRRAWPVP